MCGSGGSYRRYTSQELEQQSRETTRRTAEAEYEQRVSEKLQDNLKQINERDAEKTNERLEAVKAAIESYIDDNVMLRFGGSLSRHTYVNGLSDVDALVILRSEQFAAENPQDLLQEFDALLRRVLPKSVAVKHGDMAVTLTYPDKEELQLLPALKTSTGVRIAAEGEGWSQVIHPERLARRLTAVNQQHAGRVVPVIKIIKIAIDQWGGKIKPRGHHIDAMAIEAFETYKGKSTTKAMVELFFEYAAHRVKARLRDQTGQSDYLDEYLGKTESEDRNKLSRQFESIHAKLLAANDDLSHQAWLDGLGL
ncbi:MAG: CBASS oligonucleotide cyclase [Dehalococcoidales bacterium]|jgi:hypothetical protein